MPNIIALIGNHGITPRRVSTNKGGEYHSPCPGCGGDDRFHAWPEQNGGEGSFWCRGCGKGGDCLQFLRDFDGLNFVEAKSRLGLPDAYGLKEVDRRRQAPQQWAPEHKQRPDQVADPAVWQQHAERFVDTCHQALLADPEHLSWLAKRGIDQAMVIKYRLGLHQTKDWQPSFRPRASWGLTGGKNPRTGRPEMFVLPAGIVIPFFVEGVLHRLRIRLERLDPKNPKKRYHAVSGSVMDTFITRADAEVYLVVETELDAIMIDGQAGEMVGAVAVGSSHAKPTDAAGLCLQRATRVLNALDYDDAGTSATSWWQQTFSRHQRWPVPVGGDPGEFFEQQGREMVRQWIIKGLPPVHQATEVRLFLSIDPEQRKQSPQPPALAQTPVKQEPLAATTAPATPAEIQHLADLLKHCPVCIQKTEHAFGLRKLANYNQDQHWDALGQISRLVFSAPVFDYLHTLPAQVITAGNLEENTHAN